MDLNNKLLFKIGNYNVEWYTADSYSGILFKKENADVKDMSFLFDIKTGKQIFTGEYCTIAESDLRYAIMLLNLTSVQNGQPQTFWQRAIMYINEYHKDEKEWTPLNVNMSTPNIFIPRKKPGRKRKVGTK